jgi:hypothetical protein
MRRCISFKDLREYRDEKDSMQRMVDEEDSDEGKYHNYISEPGSPRSKEMLLNANFNKRVIELSKVYSMRDKYDNCYHQAKDKPEEDEIFKKVRVKQISKGVQTHVHELLGIDDLMPGYEKRRRSSPKSKRKLQNLMEEDSGEGEDEDGAHLMGVSKGMLDKVLHNFEGFQDRKRRKKLPPARLR